MNDENLIPMSKRTPRERSELGRKGNKASTEAKRRRKTWKELFETVGSTDAGEKYKEALLKYGIDETTFENVMFVNGIINPALKGDKWAIEMWGKITNNLKEQVELSGNVGLSNAEKEVEKLFDE